MNDLPTLTVYFTGLCAFMSLGTTPPSYRVLLVNANEAQASPYRAPNGPTVGIPIHVPLLVFNKSVVHSTLGDIPKVSLSDSSLLAIALKGPVVLDRKSVV